MSIIKSKAGAQPSADTKGKRLQKKPKSFLGKVWAQRYLLLMLLPGLLFYIIFRYGPIYGLRISFINYSPFLGYDRSPWVGLAYFERFFTYDVDKFWNLMGNTLLVGCLQTLIGFPVTILFALVLNEVRVPGLKKGYQTISYLPTFLSSVIVASIFIELFSVKNGLVNKVITMLGNEPIVFMNTTWGYHLVYQLSALWASVGNGAIIYLSALSAVDQEMYEAAEIDGCSRLKRIWHITLPAIAPTIVTMLILNIGGVIRVSADRALLFRTDITKPDVQIFATYIHDIGIMGASKSYAAAIGLFESAIAAIILLVTNTIAKKRGGNSLW